MNDKLILLALKQVIANQRLLLKATKHELSFAGDGEAAELALQNSSKLCEAIDNHFKIQDDRRSELQRRLDREESRGRDEL